MIKMINIDKLEPHPDNPRKDLGDLTELANSLKESGVLQNLTVVPADEKRYRVIIGHRRLGAAKIAGLAEVPCVISDMDRKTQLATMLLENMQRSDLTPIEEAHGIQMMLDIGETVSTVAEKTGFSESTVRKRTKLMQYDQEELKKSYGRGATLQDYMDLEKINDPKLKEKVLKTAGTDSFRNELHSAIQKEKRIADGEVMRGKLKEFATEIKSTSGMRYVKGFYNQTYEITKPDDADTVEYFFKIEGYGGATLYKKHTPDAQSGKDDWEARRAEQERRRALLDEVNSRHKALRIEFVKGVSNADVKKNLPGLIKRMIWDADGRISDIYELLEFYGYSEDDIPEDMEEQDYMYEKYMEIVAKEPEKVLFVAYYISADSYSKYYNWQAEWADNETLNHLYSMLRILGYKRSDEEIAMRKGNHELFVKKEEVK